MNRPYLLLITLISMVFHACTSSNTHDEINRLMEHPKFESDSIQRLLADLYVKSAIENPTDSISDVYLYDASRTYFLLEDSAKAIHAGRTGLEYFPNSDFNIKRVAVLAQLYTTKHADSALYFYGLIPDSIPLSRFEYKAIGDLYAQRYIHDPSQTSGLMKAGDHYFAAGMTDDAAVMYRRYVAEGDVADHQVQALNVLGFLFQQMNQPDSAERYYKLLIDRYPDTDEAQSARLILKTQSHRKSAEELLRSFGK